MLLSLSVAAQGQKYWLSGGQNISNTRNAASETKIDPGNAGKLQPRWVFQTGGDVSATPAVDDGAVYFPDWAGNLYRVDAKTGAPRWSRQIKEYITPMPNTAFARATPAIAGNALFIGTQLGNPTFGAYLLAINKVNGNLLWKTQVDAHPGAIITQSAVVYGNKVYVGIASLEEAFAADPTYPCCSFRGSVVCLDAGTGKVLWQTFMAPEGKGFSGNAVWGSTPVIDPKRNSVYVTTGNNYKVPDAVLHCVAAGGTPDEVKACIMAVDGSAQNYLDALVALDLNTGKVKWTKLAIPFDAWTVACFFDGPNCPENAGPDYDFGQGPALFTVGSGSSRRELLGAGQKSGKYWAVNPDNGAEVWSTQVGPGGTLGGLQWGSAVDGKQIYTAVGNNGYVEHAMTTGPGAGKTVKGGFWAALDAATGAVNWEYAAGNPPSAVTQPPPGDAVAINTGMVTVANGVVFAGAMDDAGTMYAFNAATGQKLWSFASGGSVNSGAAVVDGSVYWGSGYANFGLGKGNNKLYAFGLADATARLGSGTGADKAILVYPTPTRQFVKIVAKDQSTIHAIRVYDLAGRLLKVVATIASPDYELDLKAIPAGTYLVNVTTGTTSMSTKVVVLR